MNEKIEAFLKQITKDCYSQGDSFYAYKTKKGGWQFGYSNDYPMQHGNGISMSLPEAIIKKLMLLK